MGNATKKSSEPRNRPTEEAIQVPGVGETGVGSRVPFEAVLAAQRAFHEATAQHGERVGRLAELIAAEAETVDPGVARLAGELHDVGKIATSRDHLDPDGFCTDERAEFLTDHARVGAVIVSQVDSPVSSVIADAVLSHHERFDGSGYPRHLKGAEICDLGMILSMADCLDALVGRGADTRRYVGECLDDAMATFEGLDEWFSPSGRAWFRSALSSNRDAFLEVCCNSVRYPGPPPAF